MEYFVIGIITVLLVLFVLFIIGLFIRIFKYDTKGDAATDKLKYFGLGALIGAIFGINFFS